MGLHRAFPNAEIVGVDIEPQPHYPFTFVQDDAFNYPLSPFDFVWASPVCKRYTRMTNCRPDAAEGHPDQIADVRKMLRGNGMPYVIENVPGSPLEYPVMLCGQMFDLQLIRHRMFECSFPVNPPKHPVHRIKASRAGHWKPGTIMSVAGNYAPVSEARKAMGIDWMTRDEMSQAIPPAYSEYIARWSTRP